MVGATAEGEVDVAGHGARARGVGPGPVDVVAAYAVARVPADLEPPPGIHPPVPAVDRQGAGTTVAGGLGGARRSGHGGPGGVTLGRIPPTAAELARREPGLLAEARLHGRHLRLHRAAVPGFDASQLALVEVDLEVRPPPEEIGQLVGGGAHAHLL